MIKLKNSFNPEGIFAIPGHKYKMKFHDIFGKDVERDIKCVTFKIHDVNCKNGAWSLAWPLYTIGEDIEPAEFLVYKKYRCRKLCAINIKEIIDLQEI